MATHAGSLVEWSVRLNGLVFGVVAVGLMAIGCAGSGGNSSTRVDCLRNLAKLQSSINAYANDYDDVLPPAAWTDALPAYLPLSGASFDCPSVPVGSFGYAFNRALPGVSIHAISDLDTTPLLFDTIVLEANVVDAPSSAAPHRHGGRNTVFLSGRLAPNLFHGGGGTSEPEVRNVCLGRLRSLGTAFSLYTSDNDDQFPPSNWTDAVTSYVGTNTVALRCPEVDSPGYGYAMNQDLRGINTTTIDTPHTVPLVFDSSILTRNATSTFALANPPRHDGNNVAYADGHAAQVP